MAYEGFDTLTSSQGWRPVPEEGGGDYYDGVPPVGASVTEIGDVDGAVPAVSVHELNVRAELGRLRAREEATRRLRAELRVRAAGPPKLISLRDLLATPDEVVSYRVDRVWPAGGRVLLAAQFKSGKTTLRDNLVRALADNEPFLGEFAVTAAAGAIVVIDDELDERMMRRWLRDQGIRNVDRVVVVSLRGRVTDFDILDMSVRRWWAEQLRAVGASVVLLDCLRPVLDALGLDENHDAGRLLVAFDELLVEAGVSEGCIVHHMGHAGERSRGSSRLRDWPDVEWKLLREQSDEDNPAAPRFFSAYGRDVDVPESALAYDPDTRHLTFAGTGNRQQSQGRKAVPAVLALLSDHPGGLSGNRVEKHLREAGEKQRAVREALKHATTDGRVVTTPGSHNATIYRLASASSLVRQSSSLVRQRGVSEFVSSSIGDELNSRPADGLTAVRRDELVCPRCQRSADRLIDFPNGQRFCPRCAYPTEPQQDE